MRAGSGNAHVPDPAGTRPPAIRVIPDRGTPEGIGGVGLVVYVCARGPPVVWGTLDVWGGAWLVDRDALDV